MNGAEETMQQETGVDPTWSVNEVMARYPATLPVFNRYGVDTCCGGGAPVRDAARRDGADLNALLEALRVAMNGE